MRLRQYLNEKTFTISKDVKYIWERAFEKYINSLKKNNYKKSNSANVDDAVKNGMDINLLIINSSELPSKDAQEANKINPIDIFCGVYSKGNFYNPSNKKIELSLHKQVLNLIFTGRENDIPESQIKSFYQELQPERIKSTIAHELSHWLDDTNHNFHITNVLKIAKELSKPDYIKLNKKSVNMTYFEIEAQIHGIKQLKMQNKKTWDELTLADLFFKYTALSSIAKEVYSYGKEIGDIWQKMLVKRLSRENLLGKNMRTFARHPRDF